MDMHCDPGSEAKTLPPARRFKLQRVTAFASDGKTSPGRIALPHPRHSATDAGHLFSETVGMAIPVALRSQLAAVIRPAAQPGAGVVGIRDRRGASVADLRHVTGNSSPAPNLPAIVSGSATHVVAAVPLEPPSRILLVDPPLAPPCGQRLRRVDAEVVQRGIVARGTELRAREPASPETRGSRSCICRRRRRAATSARCQIRTKAGREVLPDWLRPVVDVSPLHAIVDDDADVHRKVPIDSDRGPITSLDVEPYGSCGRTGVLGGGLRMPAACSNA